MQPSGTDLLDIFKSRDRRPSAPARAAGGGRSSQPPSGGGFGGRRLWLGGTVGVLLLALAFTAGVGVGRGKRPSTPALAAVPAPQQRWRVISATLPALATNADDLRERARRDLTARWPQFAPYVEVVDAESAKAGRTGTAQFQIVMQGFESREDARAVAEELATWILDGRQPFKKSHAELMR